MEIVWTKDIEDKDFVYFNYNCKPLVWDNKLFYAYSTTDKDNTNLKGYFGTKISVIEINLSDATSKVRHISFKYKEPSKKEILLTSDWQFQVRNEQLFLFVGFWLDLNKSAISITDINNKLEQRKVKTDYYFKNQHLKYNQLSTIECFDKSTKKLNWKVKIKGYLYTDILLKNNCLTFGTAGKGGAFYCIELDNGNILTEYSNSDSSQFEWKNDSIVLRDIKGNLVQINPFSNTVLNELKLKDKLYYAPILVDKDYIYATVHIKKQNIAKIICVKYGQ